MQKCNVWNQSVFCPRVGLWLQTQHFPFYPLLSAFLFVSSYSPFIVILSIIWYLILPRTFFPFTISPRPRVSLSKQFFLSQWPSRFLFLFFISSSIILPSPTLSSTTAFLFCLSILHALFFSISTSQMLPVVFAHSVVVSMSMHHTTLYFTQSTSPASSLVLFPRARRKCFFSC